LEALPKETEGEKEKVNDDNSPDEIHMEFEE